MTLSELVVFISLVCNLDNNKVPKEHKYACMESYTNCMVGSSGEIDRKKINLCIDKTKKDSAKW